MKRIVLLVALAALATGPSFAAGHVKTERRLSEPLRGRAAQHLASVTPMTFTESERSTAAGTVYDGRARNAAVYVSAEGAHFSVGDGRVTLRLDPTADARVEPLAKRVGATNLLVGSDTRSWRTDLATFGAVRLAGHLPGADIRISGGYDSVNLQFEVARGATVSAIRLDFEAERIRIDAAGRAVLSTPDGALVLSAPHVASDRAGITARFEVSDERTLSLVFAGGHDGGGATASTVLRALGGNQESDEDEGWDVAVDAAGNTYVAGATKSAAFPVVGGLQTTHHGAFDGFITKLDPAGEIVYSTFLGGSDGDGVHGIALDAQGNIYVTGSTASTDFPIANAIQGSNNSGCDFANGCFDAFVAKLNPAGSQLIYSTYLGGENDEDGNKLRVDAAGNVTVVGSTNSSAFPTVNAVQPTWGGGFCGPFACPDAFVARLNAGGSALVYATYVGGLGYDVGIDVAVNSDGTAVVAGTTAADNFPLVGAVQARRGGETDLFASKLASNGSSFGYSTFLGGVGFDFGTGIVVDAAGNSFVAGWSDSLDFPTVGAIQGPHGGMYTSTNGAQSWLAANAGLERTTGMQTVAIDPTNAAIAYTGTDVGVFKTANGGATWSPTGRGLPSLDTLTLAVDPQTPATVYAGTAGGLGKSTDGGTTWKNSSTGLPENPYLPVLAVDPQTPTTLLAYAPAGGVFKSTDGGANWAQKGDGVLNLVFTFAFDPSDSQTVYASGFGAIYKSTDNGETWAAVGANLPFTSIYGLVVDPASSATLYAGTLSSGVFKSTDSGQTWANLAGSPEGIITSLEIDPASPANLYVTVEGDRAIRFGVAGTGAAQPATAAFGAGSNRTGLRSTGASEGVAGANPNGGVFKTTDGGQTWAPALAGLGSNGVIEIAVAPSNPAALYVATSFRGDGTVTKLDPQGSAIVSSTFIGGNDQDVATDIAIDAAGNLYLSGYTWSLDFPVASGVQSVHASPLYSDSFALKLNASVSAIVGASFVGGGDDDFASAIAVGVDGAPAVTGWTYSEDYPLVNPQVPVFSGGGFDATVSKLTPSLGAFAFSTYLGGFRDTPVVTEVHFLGEKLIVTGSFFDIGAIVSINGTRQYTNNWHEAPTEVLVVPKPLKRINPGQTVQITVRNANGNTSPPFLFTRPAQ